MATQPDISPDVVATLSPQELPEPTTPTEAPNTDLPRRQRTSAGL